MEELALEDAAEAVEIEELLAVAMEELVLEEVTVTELALDEVVVVLCV